MRRFQITGLNARISAVSTVLLMDMTIAVLGKHDASLSGVMIHNWQGLREERWFPWEEKQKERKRERKEETNK